MCIVLYKIFLRECCILHILILELGCPATFSARIDSYGDDISGGEEEKYQPFSQQDGR